MYNDPVRTTLIFFLAQSLRSIQEMSDVEFLCPISVFQIWKSLVRSFIHSFDVLLSIYYMTMATAVTETGVLILAPVESTSQRERQIKQAKRQMSKICVHFKCL